MADYTYPAGLRGVLQATFSRFEQSYTSESFPGSGTPFIQINSDDTAMVFSVSFTFKRSEMEEFEDWLKQDNNAILRGATFDIDLPTDNGVIIQEAIFSPAGIPKLDSVTNNTCNLSAEIIVRSYIETILPGAFNTPENAFSYYFYSQYQYPDSLRLPLMNDYSKQDASGFSINGLTAGDYAARIDTDDIYTVYNLSFVFKPEQAAIFRAWLAQDEFNMLKGAAFNIPLQTEYGVIIQVVRFTENGKPQLTGKVRGLLTYSAQVIARTQMDNVDGLDDAVFGPQVFSTLLYPVFVPSEQINGGATFGGGILDDFVRNYNYSESVIGASLFGGGSLDETVINYPYQEELLGGATFSGGMFVSKTYSEWPDEQINGGATFGGGLIPSIAYTNWADEQVNGTATFAGGSLG